MCGATIGLSEMYSVNHYISFNCSQVKTHQADMPKVSSDHTSFRQGLYKVFKRNEWSGHEKDMETCNMHTTTWKKSIWKNTYYMIPTVWYVLKGKTMELVKCSVIASG